MLSTTTILLWLIGIVTIVLFYLLTRTNKFWEHLKRIPGPTGYPVLGNIDLILKSPVEMFIEGREQGLEYYPIFKTCILGVAIVSMVDPKDIEIVLSNSKYNTKSIFYQHLYNWLGTGLLTSDGKKWQTRRKILTPALHSNILEKFIHIFNEETKNLVKELEKQCDQPSINIIPLVAQYTLASNLETAMGTATMQKKDKTDYKNAIDRLTYLMIYRMLRPWMHSDRIYGMMEKGKEDRKLTDLLHNISKTAIEKQKKQFNVDATAALISAGDENNKTQSYADRKRLAILDLLLSYQSSGADIDDDGIQEEVDTFLFASYDTTSVAISYILLVLANEPAAQSEIVREMGNVLGDLTKTPTYSDLQELKYMERCIKEVLRLYPSMPAISRHADEDIPTSSGYVIPKGVTICVEIYDLHHNPNVHPDPEKFDPDRFLPENIQARHPYSYIPFSAGPRDCLGQNFAILELKAVLCGILSKFKLEPVDTRKDITLTSDLVLRVDGGSIKVKFVPVAV